MTDHVVPLTTGTRAIVTGGHGFVGSHLVAALRRRGVAVTVLDVVPPPAGLPADVGHRPVDLRDPASVRAALVPADVVFHLAGNASGTISVDRPRFDFETNAEGTFNLFEALLDEPPRRVTYLSSAMVYGRPECTPMPEDHPLRPFLPYAASKLAGEHIAESMCESYGLPTVIGRAFTIYGPGEDPRRAGGEVSQFVRWHLNGRPIPAVGDADRKTRDFAHVHDLVHGLMTITERGTPGEVYNLGTGSETSLRELADIVGRVTGRPADLHCDDEVLDDSYRHVADIAKLRALGYRPRVPLAEGIADLARTLGEDPELPSNPAVFHRPPTLVETGRS
ncbi:NDP-sugar dehydratase or epimerase [Paractinoplanes deccanensis]|uniref:NDP-sugar dehydratase or epimerase n=1 Tax=Paractinoplanes deccanensis TaxID=113561 RepID=A0ABQ3YJN8_9ACTN|nr:NAD-dependent epimerase/dehydratase family protein [Actinoplanes deccanensis]GID80208.1 NDP-sugar dehydratase or epimerase [Actinoplanes deccanensis]